jgi:hypothetical protein
VSEKTGNEGAVEETAPAASTGDISRTSLTPSGIEIKYIPKPRGYFIRSQEDESGEWQEVPSVSTVLDLLEKGGLSWWGQRIGVQGVLQLFNTGAIFPVQLPGHDRPILAVPGQDSAIVAGPEQLVEQLDMFKLTVNDVRDSAGDRGTSVHDAFELWAKEGLRPDPKVFPEEERGYVNALIKFLDDVPSLEPEGFEVMVASLEHGFAGRYDFRGKTNLEHKVCHRVVPKSRNEYFSVLPPGRFLFDLKTSKDVYLDQSRQLEGYEIAGVESGYEPTDRRAILNVQADGLYQLSPSFGEADDFLVVLDLWRSAQRMKARKKEHGGARKK